MPKNNARPDAGPFTFPRIRALEVRLGSDPGELFAVLSDRRQAECWDDLAGRCARWRERQRTLDPSDTTLAAWAPVPDVEESPSSARVRPPRHLRAVPTDGPAEDVLLTIDPPTYFEALTGEEVPPNGMVRCPLHEDRTPSCKVYPDAARGWHCFGCQRGGTIIDLGAGLYGIAPRGAGFLELRRRLADALLGRVAA